VIICLIPKYGILVTFFTIAFLSSHCTFPSVSMVYRQCVRVMLNCFSIPFCGMNAGANLKKSLGKNVLPFTLHLKSCFLKGQDFAFCQVSPLSNIISFLIC
jgi:hypothetical protein